MPEAMVGLSEQELQQIETNYELHLRLAPNRICPTGDHPADIEARLAAEVRRLRGALSEISDLAMNGDQIERGPLGDVAWRALHMEPAAQRD